MVRPLHRSSVAERSMMPIPHSFQQEPDRADPPMRSIWFGMRCDYTRAALEGAMASGDAPAPVVIVLPAGWARAPDASELVIPAELTVRKASRMVRAVGDAFGPLVVPEAGTGELVRVAGVIEDQRDEPVAGRDLAGMVRAQFADGTAWFWRNTARKD